VHAGELDAALALLAELPSTSARHYDRLCLEGLVLRRLRRFADAERVLGAAIELHRRGPTALVERAWLWLDQQRHAEAMVDAELAVKNAQNGKPEVMAAAFSVYGHALGWSGDLPNAVVALQKAVELQPEHAEMHTQLGWALFYSHRFAEAAVACARALELAPGWLGAMALREAIAAPRP